VVLLFPQIDRKRLRKLEKEYQAMKEAEAALEDPVARLEVVSMPVECHTLYWY
jgi:predicted  nucleic acid-binding Zn-ribbon protein